MSLNGFSDAYSSVSTSLKMFSAPLDGAGPN